MDSVNIEKQNDQGQSRNCCVLRTTGYRHDSIPAGIRALRLLGEQAAAPSTRPRTRRCSLLAGPL